MGGWVGGQTLRVCLCPCPCPTSLLDHRPRLTLSPFSHSPKPPSHPSLPRCLQSYVADLQRFTKNHSKLQCFDLGFALDTFRMVALTSNFRKLQSDTVVKACQRWVAGVMRAGCVKPVGVFTALARPGARLCLR